jgi:hypothetical protein
MDYPVYYCNCPVCQAMCEYCPCLGTPADIKRLIKAGYGDRLMIGVWGLGETIVIMPAIQGHEGFRGDLMGTCTFFTNRRRCELHDLTLKPTEGVGAIHNQDDDESDMVHAGCLNSWKTDEGREVVEQWRHDFFGGPMLDSNKVSEDWRD